MKTLVRSSVRLLGLLGVAVAIFALGGCVLPNDPAVFARSERWFRKTDPAKYFNHERAHGRVYFIGFTDRLPGEDSAVPGVPPNEPLFRQARTWYLAAGPTPREKYNVRYEASAREFARRYNVLVVAWLREHPAPPPVD